MQWRDRVSELARRVSQRPVVVLAAVSVLFFGLALSEAMNDSPTFDETVIVPSGVTYLTRHDLRMNLEHPPLGKALEAIPVLFANPKIPDGESWREAPNSTFGFDFYTQNADKIDTITTLSRLVGILMAIGIAWVLYAIGRRLGSQRVGLIAAIMWLTTPLVLAHGHLDGLDIPFTLALAGAALAVLWYIDAPSWPRAAVVGILGGATLLTRTTGLVVVPLLALAILFTPSWRPNRRALLHALAVLVVAWIALWAGYRALAPNPSPQSTVAARELVQCVQCDYDKTVVDRVLDVIPVPAEYRIGVRMQSIMGTRDLHGYMLGHQVTGHSWWFWPASMITKLPIPVMLLLFASPLAWWFARDRRRSLLLAVAVPAAVLALAIVVQAAPVGARYLLPVIALAMVGAAFVFDRVLQLARTGAVLAVVALLVVVQVVSFADSADDSVAWTTWPFRPGYRFVSDSNLDWAQDLKGLEDFSLERHPLVEYWSPLTFTQRIKGTEPLYPVDRDRIDGWVAVGASALTVIRRDEFSWLRGYCPVGTIGGTVLLYRFDGPPDLSPSGEQPVGPCFDSRFSRRTD